MLPSFVPATLDAMLPSNDTLSVRDPARPPALIATTMLPSAPPLILHTADVSDTHAVASMPDCPARPCPLYLHPSHRPRPTAISIRQMRHPIKCAQPPHTSILLSQPSSRQPYALAPDAHPIA